MREIKFRAWDKEEQKMWFNVQNAYDTLEQHCACSAEEFKTCDCDCLCVTSFGDLIKDDNYIVMQYTGLKDKNGVEIYEGDVCRQKLRTEKVIIENGLLSPFYEITHVDDGGADLWIDDGDYEVIGNIYEDKKLLEAK